MIIVECNPDELLVKKLIPEISKEEYSHGGNKTGVIKRLIKRNAGEGFVGIIDKDPGDSPPGYFSEYKLVEEIEKYDIELYETSNKTKLIVLYPNLEGWIIKAAHFSHILLKDFNLPDDEDELHEIINANLKEFEKLVDRLKNENKYLDNLRKILLETHK